MQQFLDKELLRKQEFAGVWENELDDVFADVAAYYDRVNIIASLGFLNQWLRSFVSTIDTSPNQKVLDVCAGTNVVGRALLSKEPSLDVQAMDKSAAMQEVGQRLAKQQGFTIKSEIGDVHRLPFPDNHFDIVTLQWASRHLQIVDVFSEINRVLKPGGYFYHCDMLRPKKKFVAQLYYTYLSISVPIVAFIFRSGPAALACREYFIDAIRMFYSSDELSELLATIGYTDISKKDILGGMIGLHKACKAG
jgi:demethylmenaquinone methyltransferase/2-methoxy-6-polyprenyl-1,4-benzoquinol methylase